MAALRATSFFIGEVSGSGNHTVYTVPAGKRIVVHGITIQDVSGSSHTVQVRTIGLGTIIANTLAGYPAGGSGWVMTPYIVLNATDGIVIGLPGGGDVTVTISGTFLFV